jgi:hypothetical protein
MIGDLHPVEVGIAAVLIALAIATVALWLCIGGHT